MLTVPDRWRATRQKPGATEGRTRGTRVETVEVAVQSSREIRRERLVRKQICAISEDVSVDDSDLDTSPSRGCRNGLDRTRKITGKSNIRLLAQTRMEEPLPECQFLPFRDPVKSVDTALPSACLTDTWCICEFCPPDMGFPVKVRHMSHHQNSN